MIGRKLPLAIALAVVLVALVIDALRFEDMEEFCGPNATPRIARSRSGCKKRCRETFSSFTGKSRDSDRGHVCCCGSANFEDSSYMYFFGEADDMTNGNRKGWGGWGRK